MWVGTIVGRYHCGSVPLWVGTIVGRYCCGSVLLWVGTAVGQYHCGSVPVSVLVSVPVFIGVLMEAMRVLRSVPVRFRSGSGPVPVLCGRSGGCRGSGGKG